MPVLALKEKKVQYMTSSECLFCKIISGKIPAEIIDQNDDVVVIKDLHPKAPVHYLIIPKKHVENISSLDGKTAEIMSKIALMAKKLSHEKLNDGDFRLIINNGPGVGQSVFHLHCHFLSGKKMTDF